MLEPQDSRTVAAFHASWTEAAKVLQSGTVGLVTGYDSFAAIKDNGQVVTWGYRYINDRTASNYPTDTRNVWALI